MLEGVTCTSVVLQQTSPFFPSALSQHSEERFFQDWDPDIKRAAVSAAKTAGVDRSHSEDFAQEARMRLLTVRRSWGAAAEPYIRRVIANAVRAARRSRVRDLRHVVAIEDTTETAAIEVASYGRAGTDLFVISAVKRLIQLLPDKLRALYELVYVQGCTQREAAAELGVTQPRVAQLHAELLQRGRQELGYLFL